MKRRLFTQPRAIMAIALLLSIAAIVPALAGRRFPDPVYITPGAIADAQAILEKEHYLTAGRYQRGTMDEATVMALRRFQAEHMIAANGRLDRDTMALILTHGPATGTGLAAAPAASAPAIAEARRAPEAAPAPEAATAPPEETAQLARAMPVTGSPLPYRAAMGALLLGAGVFILRRVA